MEIKNLDLQNQIDELRDMIYPVGSIYFSTNSANPSTIWGGTWTQIKGRFLIGVDQNSEDGKYWTTSKLTGGDVWLSLGVENLPAHTHRIQGSTSIDGNHTHNISGNNGQGNLQWGYAFNYDGTSAYNAGAIDPTSGSHSHTLNFTSQSTGQGQEKFFVPPYYSVYIWERTA